MSVLTELFVDDEQKASTYNPATAAGIERAQLGGLTNLEFETLWAIVEGEEWDVEKHALREVASGDSFWVHQFPAEYVAQLQALGPSEISAAAATWAATDEIMAAPEDVSPVIDQLVALARSATKTGKGLFIWTAL
jgi:hypothetical protein